MPDGRRRVIWAGRERGGSLDSQSARFLDDSASGRCLAEREAGQKTELTDR
jgi:hypothetical protein